MGTIIFHDSVEPTIDREADAKPGFKRQVEIFTVSSHEGVNIRFSDLGDLNMGSGHSVLLTRDAARAFLDGLERAMGRFGYDED